MSFQTVLNSFGEQKFYSKACYLLKNDTKSLLVRYPFLTNNVSDSLPPVSYDDRIEYIYDVASLTKIFVTGSMLADALVNYKLDINATIVSYPKTVNHFQLSNNYIMKITLKELISHTSGLIPWAPFYACEKNNLWDYIFSLSSRDYKRRYSDIGFMLIGKILEEHLDMSLDEWFKKKLIVPLNLKNTGFRNQLNHHDATAFVPTSLGNPFEQILAEKFFIDYPQIKKSTKFTTRLHRLQGECNDFNAFSMNQVAPHAGLFSTAEELALIVHHWIHQEPMYLECFKFLLSKNQHPLEHLFCSSDETLSWNKNKAMFGHHGFTGCSFSMDNNFKTYRVFLSNRQFYGLDSQGHYPPWKKILNALAEFD